MPSRSSRAIAGICNSSPAAINSSGTEAPSKKLKADRACSSTYIGLYLCLVLCALFFTKYKAQSTKYFLVVSAFDKPGISFQFAINAIKRLFLALIWHDCHVPLVTRPASVAPPVAGSAPWTSHVDHLAINAPLFAPGADPRGQSAIDLDHGAQRRAKRAKPETRMSNTGRWP